MSRTKIKVCGVRTLEDALAIIEGGVDFIGFQFIPFAKKKISLEKALEIIKKLPKEAQLVGVFFNEKPERVNEISKKCRLAYVQLHGTEEPPEYCKLIEAPIIKGFEIMNELDMKIFKPYENIVNKFVLDTPHGPERRSGQTFDFKIAKEACKRYDIMIAGGLNAGNVGQAIKLLHPWGVDVSGAVMENDKMNLNKIKEFIKAVRETEK